MNLPRQVVAELSRHLTMPEDLSSLIEVLIEREVENDYPALSGEIKRLKDLKYESEEEEWDLHSRNYERREYHSEVDRHANVKSAIDDAYADMMGKERLRIRENALIAYVTSIHSILAKLPPYGMKGAKMFSAPIRDAARIESGHNYTFAELTVEGNAALWSDLLSFEIGYDLPQASRFEHTHVCARSGSGKTELLAYLIEQDIRTDATVIVMTPKGSLIPNLSRLKSIPDDRLILVRPLDDPPLALNVFDLGSTGTDQQTNNAVGLINYILSSILEAEPSPKQRTLLNNCIRLMLRVPDATLLTLRSLLASATLPEGYQKYVSRLSPLGQQFFNEQFGSTKKEAYGATKGELLWRMDLLLENTIIERIFSHPKSRLKFQDELDAGKVILIDTSLRGLGATGSAFLGRFFIALVNFASQQRDSSFDLRPVYFYIDEASTYLSEQIEDIMERARESKIGLTLSHQHLQQLTKVSVGLEQSVLTNTGTKIYGNNPEDISTFAKQMDCDPECFKALPKYSFAHHINGSHGRPDVLTAPFPHLAKLPQRTDAELRDLIDRNRAKYSAPPAAKPEYEPRAEPKPSPQQDAEDDLEALNKNK